MKVILILLDLNPYIFQIIMIKIIKYKEGYFSHHKNNLVLYQPDLGIYPISKKGRYKPNYYTIGINVYAINSLGLKRFSSFLSSVKDTTIVFIIFNIAKSFNFIA